MLVLSGASGGLLLCLFTSVNGTPVGIASASISVVCFIRNGILKTSLKREKKLNIQRLLYWPEIKKLRKNNKALIDSDISHDEFTLMIMRSKIL